MLAFELLFNYILHLKKLLSLKNGTNLLNLVTNIVSRNMWIYEGICADRLWPQNKFIQEDAMLKLPHQPSLTPNELGVVLTEFLTCSICHWISEHQIESPKCYFIPTTQVAQLHRFLITDEGLLSQQWELVYGCDPPNNWGFECRRPGSPSVMCAGIRLSQWEESKSAQRRQSPNLGAPPFAVFFSSHY